MAFYKEIPLEQAQKGHLHAITLVNVPLELLSTQILSICKASHGKTLFWPFTWALPCNNYAWKYFKSCPPFGVFARGYSVDPIWIFARGAKLGPTWLFARLENVGPTWLLARLVDVGPTWLLAWGMISFLHGWLFSRIWFIFFACTAVNTICVDVPMNILTGSDCCKLACSNSTTLSPCTNLVPAPSLPVPIWYQPSAVLQFPVPFIKIYIKHNEKYVESN